MAVLVSMFENMDNFVANLKESLSVTNIHKYYDDN